MLTTLALFMSQVADAERPSLFPFPSWMHYPFVAVAFLFFIISFLKQRKPYQLIFAIAIPLTLTLKFVTEKDRTLFYIIGAIEALLVLAAIISAIVCRPKKKDEPQADAGEKKE